MEPDKKQTIMIADDDEIILKFINKILRYFSYDVIVVKEATELVKIYKERRNEIDLIIIDIKMIAINYKECLKQLIYADKRVKVLIICSYLDHYLAKKIVSYGAKAYLVKPIEIKKLNEVIKKLLDD